MRASKIPSMNAPSFRASSVALVLLSLSIGWGIRGNYGHEAGAMIPGALAAVAMALVSGRSDWRSRVPYFAFFGALGWAFGGSIAYMVPASYTFSGDLATQVYGFFATFLEAFLWAGLGGAATAYAAAEERENLTAIFRPLLWVMAAWALQYILQDTPFRLQDRIFAAFGADRSDFRQRDPLYWLDSEWLEAVLALAALAAFDLWDRRFQHAGPLAALATGGALAGAGVVWGLKATGMSARVVAALVHPQGDLSKFSPEDLVTNWPGILTNAGPHLGWILGALVGVVIYFWRYGAWRNGSDLLVRMACWSLVIFILGPVLLSNVPLFRDLGGFRLAPPRGDSWANILGCYIGLVLHFRKTRQPAVIFAAVLAGALGGFALTTAQFLKLLLVSPGNPVLTSDTGAIEFWKHWRSANWHSVMLEQFAGVLYGLAIVIPLGLLATRLPIRPEPPKPEPRPWTKIVAVLFVLNVVGYLNIVKNVRDWTEARPVGGGIFRSVEPVLRAPLVGDIRLSTWTWFTIGWVAFTAVTAWLLWRHRRQPVALIPKSWVGRGQLFYLVFLWMIVLANFAKALVSFHESRLATEGIITANALVCSALILGFIQPESETRTTDSSIQVNWGRLTRQAVGWLALFLVGAMALYTAGIRGLYGDRWVGWGGHNLRFGDDADWRAKPILRSGKHR